MDRGAARSRKRSQADTRPTGNSQAESSSHASRPRAEGTDRPQHPRPPNGGPGPRPRIDNRPAAPARVERKRKPLLDEATRYKPKAIRSSAALIWSEAAFAIPPPKDVLEGVRRVDLAGSGVTDVSWLQGAGVTWLNLAGCTIEDGWDAVGSLKELSVLNISNCGLKALPSSLSGLTNLKALVAMGNEWTGIDGGVMSSWKELNSLIVSHSPSLTSLPTTLAQLHHLSKLTFSHCPKLTAASLPDLSALPVLRDVKMNNLPLLTSLPSHISTWGTGDLSLTRKPRQAAPTSDGESEDDQPGESSTVRQGEGLEVLDLGNCSLPYSAIEPIFIKPKSKSSTVNWAHLRSLTLHSNPLSTTHPNYSELLQASDILPNLQIIDAKRVVERKRKGEVSESKKERMARERREVKMKPSGANVGGTKEMRKWGGEEGERVAVNDEEEKVESGEKVKSKKRKAGIEEGEVKVKKAKKEGDERKSKTKVEKEDRKSKSKPEPTPAAAPPTTDPSLDPSASAPARKANKPAKEPVFEVIDVAKAAAAAKGEKKVTRLERRLKDRRDKKAGIEPVKESGPVDLKSLFGSNIDGSGDKDGAEDSGLGVGGW